MVTPQPDGPGAGPLWRHAAPARFAALRSDPVWRGEGVAHGQGMPVLLIPGFMTGDPLMRTLAGWLSRTGHRPRRSGMRVNARCAERAAGLLEDRLERLAEEAEGRVAIIGFSRGAHFARVLAVRRPDAVAGVVAVGMPPLDPRAITPLVALPTVAITLAGSVVPGAIGVGCFLGRCCAAFREDLHAPFPPEVGFVSLWSRRDLIVDHRRIAERDAQHIEVDGTHLGMSVSPRVYREIAAALAGFKPNERSTAR